MLRKLAAVSMLLALILAGCGESEREKEHEGSRGEACVATPEPVSDPNFPTPFPTIDDVTWTSSKQAGPSQIVTGYTGDALEDLFNEMKEKFSEGGFSVTKSEKDPHDAEVNFAGAKNSGQVRLAEECQGRTSVTITIRPA